MHTMTIDRARSIVDMAQRIHAQSGSLNARQHERVELARDVIAANTPGRTVSQMSIREKYIRIERVYRKLTGPGHSMNRRDAVRLIAATYRLAMQDVSDFTAEPMGNRYWKGESDVG